MEGLLVESASASSPAFWGGQIWSSCQAKHWCLHRCFQYNGQLPFGCAIQDHQHSTCRRHIDTTHLVAAGCMEFFGWQDIWEFWKQNITKMLLKLCKKIWNLLYLGCILMLCVPPPDAPKLFNIAKTCGWSSEQLSNGTKTSMKAWYLTCSLVKVKIPTRQLIQGTSQKCWEN